MITSYAYDDSNIGHQYIHSEEFDADLKRCTEEVFGRGKEGEEDGNYVDSIGKRT